MKWEYNTVKIDPAGGKFDENTFKRLLNELGQQGWELVNTFDTNQKYGASRHVIAILKRPIG